MSTKRLSDSDYDIRREVVEHAREEEEEIKEKKKRKSGIEEIEAEEALEEEPPAPGYPDETVIPVP